MSATAFGSADKSTCSNVARDSFSFQKVLSVAFAGAGLLGVQGGAGRGARLRTARINPACAENVTIDTCVPAAT